MNQSGQTEQAQHAAAASASLASDWHVLQRYELPPPSLLDTVLEHAASARDVVQQGYVRGRALLAAHTDTVEACSTTVASAAAYVVQAAQHLVAVIDNELKLHAATF